MTILSAQGIRKRCSLEHAATRYRLAIEPYEPESKKEFGMSYGVTAAGYDIRLGALPDNYMKGLLQPGDFILAASMEHIRVPYDLQVIVHDKSTWARQGLALQNTVLEPGWFGHITLELSNHGKSPIELEVGMPIAQLVFHMLDEPTDRPYNGKYQNQGAMPAKAIFEGDSNDV